MTAGPALQRQITPQDEPMAGPHDTQSEYFRTLGVLQGTMDSMLRQFDDFRQDIAARHRDNKESIERLMADLHRENDRSSLATIERVDRLEKVASALTKSHDENSGEIAATRRIVTLIVRIGPWAIPVLAYLLSRVSGK
jgi:hypothetical protein